MQQGRNGKGEKESWIIKFAISRPTVRQVFFFLRKDAMISLFKEIGRRRVSVALHYGDRGDGVARSFAPSSTAPNPRLEVNRMKSRIKYSPLCIPGIPKGGCKKAEGREREHELTPCETRRGELPCI